MSPFLYLDPQPVSFIFRGCYSNRKRSLDYKKNIPKENWVWKLGLGSDVQNRHRSNRHANGPFSHSHILCLICLYYIINYFYWKDFFVFCNKSNYVCHLKSYCNVKLGLGLTLE